MRAVQRQPISLLDSWPAPDTDAVHQALREELRRFDRKVVVLDDDPTGVQTVHDISVYTDWTEETFRAGLESNDRLFFVLTNSRSFSAGETTRVHREIAEHLAAASQKREYPCPHQPQRFHASRALPSGNGNASYRAGSAAAGAL